MVRSISSTTRLNCRRVLIPSRWAIRARSASSLPEPRFAKPGSGRLRRAAQPPSSSVDHLARHVGILDVCVPKRERTPLRLAFGRRHHIVASGFHGGFELWVFHAISIPHLCGPGHEHPSLKRACVVSPANHIALPGKGSGLAFGSVRETHHRARPAPQLFEPVVRPLVWRKDVDDEVTEVQQHPTVVAATLPVAQFDALRTEVLFKVVL